MNNTVWHKKIKKKSKPNWGRKWVQAEAYRLEAWSTGKSYIQKKVHTNKILNEAHTHTHTQGITTTVGLQLYEREAELGGLTTDKQYHIT